jgi:hypothetical protein
MTWFEDLSPCTYFRDRGETVLAVGWLERDHIYNKGPIREKEKVVDTLVRLLDMPWAPKYFMGSHGCSLCRRPHMPLTLWRKRTQISTRTSNPLTLLHQGTLISLGCDNVFVPGNQCIYVAPSLIVHYILDHGYAPPEPFCQALLACPPMGSTDYFQTLISNAPDSFGQLVYRTMDEYRNTLEYINGAGGAYLNGDRRGDD